jgi:hypothetical protein
LYEIKLIASNANFIRFYFLKQCPSISSMKLFYLFS